MLKEFYFNKNMRDEVRVYMLQLLSTQTLEKAFDGQDTKSAKDTRSFIDHIFDTLQEEFEPKVGKKIDPNISR